MEAATTIAPSRHVWLERLIAAPVEQVRALVEGSADIPPFGRAEPSDAATTLLFALSKDDPALRAFDDGALGALEYYRKASPRLKNAAWDRNALAAFDLMRVIQRLCPGSTSVDLHRRFPYWYNWAENLVIDQGLDLRREYWRALALTQEPAKDAGLDARRLLPFWLNVCSEAGQRGRYDETYLIVGLLGLRRLPLGDDQDANEEAALQGLARWAEAQLPKKKQFLREWAVIEGAFPRDALFWAPLVAKVLDTVEDQLSHKTNQRQATFPAAEWWREEVELVRGAKVAALVGESSPPDPGLRDIVLDGIRKERPFRTLQSQIAPLIAQHERYATRTGDTYYLVRTACNVGRQLLRGGDEPEKRAAKARDLARLTLRFEACDVYAWSLWRDAFAALGDMDAAELVGWEAVRRFPENAQYRSQLALLLSDRLDRAGDAETLLRETMSLFPKDAVARTQLASILGGEKARLSEAISILDDALEIDPEDLFAKTMKQRFLEGRTSKTPNAVLTTANVSDARQTDLPADMFATACARRALFRVRNGENDALAEVRRIFEEDENLAYARYVAAAAGVIEPSVDDTVLATAFLAAAKGESATALHPLLEHAYGFDAIILSMAGAARGDSEAVVRLQTWLNEPANALVPRDSALRAIAARASKSLQDNFIGDMLAASLGTAIAA